MPRSISSVPLQGRAGDNPAYVEAYPRVSLGEARRAVLADTPLVLWRDAKLLAVGLGSIEHWARERIVLSYRVEDLPYLWAKQGKIEFELVWKGSDESNRQPYAICPSCTRSVGLILLRDGEWRCTRCHGLPNRSRQLSADVRASEKRKAIYAAIRAARWRGDDTSALSEDYGSLLARFGDQPITPSLLYAAEITSEWVPRAPVFAGVP